MISKTNTSQQTTPAIWEQYVHHPVRIKALSTQKLYYNSKKDFANPAIMVADTLVSAVAAINLLVVTLSMPFFLSIPIDLLTLSIKDVINGYLSLVDLKFFLARQDRKILSKYIQDAEALEKAIQPYTLFKDMPKELQSRVVHYFRKQYQEMDKLRSVVKQIQKKNKTRSKV